MSDNGFWACFWFCITLIFAIFIGGVTYINHKNINKYKFEVCVAAGNQYINGNCVIGKSK